MKREDYVSLEVARLLKKKGFNEYCGAYYHLIWKDMTEEECFEVAPNHDFRNKDNGYRAGAPTLYEAQKWLRSKKIYVLAQPAKESGVTVWYYQVVNDNDPDDIFYTTSQDTYPNYETALNEGIKYALNSFEL